MNNQQRLASRRQSQRSINASVLETLIGDGGSKIEIVHTIQIDKQSMLFLAISAAGIVVLNQLVKRF